MFVQQYWDIFLLRLFLIASDNVFFPSIIRAFGSVKIHSRFYSCFDEERRIAKASPIGEIASENKQGRRLIEQDGSAVLVKRSYLKNVLLNGTWPSLPLR